MGINYTHFLILWRCSNIAKQEDLLINDQIRISELMVIGPNGEKMGVKKLDDAKTLANYAGLDLVLMSENSTPAVAKIMDYNKYRYERQKKAKEALKKQRASMSELKEYRLSPVIDVGDFDTKVRNATKYLEKGDRIKLTVRFKGRQMAHTELGRDVLLKFADELSEFGQIEIEPKLEGKQMSLLLAPKK